MREHPRVEIVALLRDLAAIKIGDPAALGRESRRKTSRIRPRARDRGERAHRNEILRDARGPARRDKPVKAYIAGLERERGCGRSRIDARTGARRQLRKSKRGAA